MPEEESSAPQDHGVGRNSRDPSQGPRGQNLGRGIEVMANGRRMDQVGMDMGGMPEMPMDRQSSGGRGGAMGLNPEQQTALELMYEQQQIFSGAHVPSHDLKFSNNREERGGRSDILSEDVLSKKFLPEDFLREDDVRPLDVSPIGWRSTMRRAKIPGPSSLSGQLRARIRDFITLKDTPGMFRDNTPKKRRLETPHERHVAPKQPKATGSISAEPLVSQSEQAISTDDCSPSPYDTDHIEGVTLSPYEEFSNGTGPPRCRCLSMTNAGSLGAEPRHWLSESDAVSSENWEAFRETLPESCKWDVEFHATTGTNQHSRGCWTYASSENGVTSHIPLTIANVPVVLPVQYRWPPEGGVQPPPDPRPFLPIDCRAGLSLKTIQDVFLTFEGSIGFYLLINGFLQILVPATFDTAWASSHLPHKFGGLSVSYIEQSLEGTMIPSQVQTSRSRSPLLPLSSLFRSSRSAQPLQINDFIEARAGSSSKEKFAGRIGLKVVNQQRESLLLMSSHVITAAILGKSFWSALWNPLKKLRDDWNDHAEIWAGGAKIGRIAKTYDKDAEIYPNGFNHDITLIKPTNPTVVEGIKSPIQDLGWLSKDEWPSLRMQNSVLKILGTTETHRNAKCIKCNLQSEVMIVGEGVFLNQTAAAGSRSLKEIDELTWMKMVSRAVLYRLSPDFDPPNGYSGIALYTENGKREDGSTGPGVVGIQSFVQRSMFAQTFNMPQNATMERHLRQGRIAFYGAFQVPDDLRANYSIV